MIVLIHAQDHSCLAYDLLALNMEGSLYKIKIPWHFFGVLYLGHDPSAFSSKGCTA